MRSRVRRDLERGSAKGMDAEVVIANTSDSLPSTTIPFVRRPDELVSIHVRCWVFQPLPMRDWSHLQVGSCLHQGSKRTRSFLSFIQDGPSFPHPSKEAGFPFLPTSFASNHHHMACATHHLLHVCPIEILHVLAILPGSFFSKGYE